MNRALAFYMLVASGAAVMYAWADGNELTPLRITTAVLFAICSGLALWLRFRGKTSEEERP